MKGIAVVFLALVLSSCQIMDIAIDSRNEEKIEEMELYYGDFSEIQNIKQIGRWIYKNIEYKYDSTDYWQTPEETINLGTGDCEDTAILYINILYIRFGIKADLGMINDDDSREIVEGGLYNHSVVVMPDGTKISAQGGAIEDEPLKFIYYFDDIFGGK